MSVVHHNAALHQKDQIYRQNFSYPNLSSFL